MNAKNTNHEENTAHQTCVQLVQLLVKQGIEYAVCCPGSRNAPLLMALARCRDIKKVVIADERSAGHAAIGLAQQSRRPVAVVCTSGTALLNLAPAAAEAYYAHIPLIIVSADRPIEWIDQNDSQTLHQHNALQTAVKWHCSLPSQPADQSQAWWVGRMLNEAITAAITPPAAPVHINVHIGEPICGQTTQETASQLIASTPIEHTLAPDTAAALNREIASAKRVLVVCGFMPPQPELSQALSQFACRSNVAVLCEQISNVKAHGIISQLGTVLTEITEEERNNLAPDLLIYAGGALVTRLAKEYLRRYANRQQWRVGEDRCIIDNMQHITRTVAVSASTFFQAMAQQPGAPIQPSTYAADWQAVAHRANASHAQFLTHLPWCSLSAMHTIAEHIPQGTLLHLSNGLSVRLAQLFNIGNASEWWSNRGVSGIDGCTSTALGASIAATNANVLLITGDMSFGYDINGLSSQYNSPRFKVIVMCNDGGGIFRFIKGTSSLPELEDYFEVRRATPVKELAAAFRFSYYSAHSQQELDEQIDAFLADGNAAILAVHTSSETDTEVLHKHYHRSHKQKK